MSSKIFDGNNGFNRTLYKIGSLCLLNIYFLLCCIPVITIGAAITASNSVLFKMKEHTDVKITSTFFKSFKNNFIDSTLVWIILAGFGSAAIFFLINMLSSDGGGVAIAIIMVCCIVLLFVLMIFTYIFILIARYENFITTQILNALKLGVSQLNWCMVVWIIWAAAIVPFTFLPELFIYLGWLWLAVGFAALMYASMGAYMRVLRKFENHEE